MAWQATRFSAPATSEQKQCKLVETPQGAVCPGSCLPQALKGAGCDLIIARQQAKAMSERERPLEASNPGLYFPALEGQEELRARRGANKRPLPAFAWGFYPSGERGRNEETNQQGNDKR